MGATTPPPQKKKTTWKFWEFSPPPILDCRYRSLLFLFVFARELMPFPENSGSNPRSFLVLGRGYLGFRKTFDVWKLHNVAYIWNISTES